MVQIVVRDRLEPALSWHVHLVYGEWRPGCRGLLFGRLDRFVTLADGSVNLSAVALRYRRGSETLSRGVKVLRTPRVSKGTQALFHRP